MVGLRLLPVPDSSSRASARSAPGRAAASCSSASSASRWPSCCRSSGPPRPACASSASGAPSLYLLQGYWLCGLFFQRPSLGIERRLLAFDRWLFERGGLRAVAAPRAAPRRFLVRGGLPAGLPVRPRRLRRLPGPRTPRPRGRLLGGDAHRVLHLLRHAARGSRRARRAHSRRTAPLWMPHLILRRPQRRGAAPDERAGETPVRAATRRRRWRSPWPSSSADAPAIGGGFLVVAASIVIATVLGRYHYALDALLGVAVGVAAWESRSHGL